ncbi:MAG TPA: cytochrome c biogenesis protein CcdA, partial [Candidatus Margulisiibacteriota bacterium]|nr:cytochrome c biogenesis protein CcdA [Candidatus Margulisiibacteriota bacterium]
GMLVSFTPCIYPLIPISAGYIGARSAGSRARGFFLSLSYVTGVAVTYSLLGVAASLTGTIFGKISTHPFVRLLSGLVIIVFALSLLDLFVLNLPLPVKLTQGKRQGYLSALFLGLVSGLIVSPCLTPVLGSILVYLAEKHSFLYGGTLLFSFAFGMGSLLILIGTFSSALLYLPKSGAWLLYIKRACAVILFGAGVYLIFTAIRRF